MAKLSVSKGKSSFPQVVHPSTSRYAKCLFFGPSGQGKTYLLGTAQDDPRTYPMLFLDYEGGTSTLDGWEPEIDVVKIRSWADYNKVYAWLQSGRHPYNSVCLDSISETHIFALLTQLDSGTRDRKIPDLLEQGDYGVALVQMRRLLRAFRDLPLHFFAVCMDKKEVEPREGMVQKPALAGALADEAPGIFEMVAYLAIGESQSEEGELVVERYLVIKNSPKIRTKVRLPKGRQAPDYLEDPNVTSILDLLGCTAVPQDAMVHTEPVKTAREEFPEETQDEGEQEELHGETDADHGEEQPSEDSEKKTVKVSTRKVISKK